MNQIPRRLGVAVLAATAVMGTQAALATQAHAAPQDAPAITVKASDDDVSHGQQFQLSGRLTRDGKALAGSVQVYSRSGDSWVALNGAKVTTRADGSYRVRVVLSATGKRVLRVVGDPTAAGLRNAAARTSVTVR